MNPLALSVEEYRRVYERIAQVALDYLASIEERSCFPGISGADAKQLFDEDLPEQGIGPAALDDLTKVVEGSRAQGPRFFGYVLGSGEPVAAGADLLASVLNQNVTAWRSGPAAVSLEHLRRRMAGAGNWVRGISRQPDGWRIIRQPDGPGHGARGAAARE